jgi:hypothetical protein
MKTSLNNLCYMKPQNYDICHPFIKESSPKRSIVSLWHATLFPFYTGRLPKRLQKFIYSFLASLSSSDNKFLHLFLMGCPVRLFPLIFNSNTLLGIILAYETPTKTCNKSVFEKQNFIYDKNSSGIKKKLHSISFNLITASIQ